ncbi:hypothetical protein R52603_00311 [Paraburkholderia saeva]|uniref:Uncharacterized protein n=1 Tax=Paraburkholderia saeva TaxID=2777537 RepID=A0A9N8X2D2_9BURK|nr:hypothetical protein R52603_00311 [Paraburkholderia saeva]CAG4894521.1 hypothetical protein LMG31841_01931 [Paraburkholderia saeva]CAG4898790.1 hypothetical protein R70241_02526 [Paraburkholderia saeva]
MYVIEMEEIFNDMKKKCTQKVQFKSNKINAY